MTTTIIPEVINLQGPNEIVQGSDFFLELQIKDVDGAIVSLVGVNQATDIKCEFRTNYFTVASPGTGGVITGCPVPRVYIVDEESGKVCLHLPSNQTAWTSTQVLNGKWDMEILIDGLKYRPFMGAWTIDGKQITSRYSV